MGAGAAVGAGTGFGGTSGGTGTVGFVNAGPRGGFAGGGTVGTVGAGVAATGTDAGRTAAGGVGAGVPTGRDRGNSTPNSGSLGFPGCGATGAGAGGGVTPNAASRSGLIRLPGGAGGGGRRLTGVVAGGGVAGGIHEGRWPGAGCRPPFGSSRTMRTICGSTAMPAIVAGTPRGFFAASSACVVGALTLRGNRMLTFRGVTRPLIDWADDLGLTSEVIRGRIDALGWSVDRALTTPCRGISRSRPVWATHPCA